MTVINQSAPITWLVDGINDIVGSGASAIASAIVTLIIPLVSVFFGIYIILICVNYLRGAENEPVIDFGMKCAGFAIILGIGLNVHYYTTTLIPIIISTGSDLANAVSGNRLSLTDLDKLALHYSQIIEQGYESANLPAHPENTGPLFLFLLKVILVFVGLIPFLVTVVFFISFAGIASILVAMVGPIFFAFLLFPATHSYFSAWFNAALRYALFPIFIAVIAFTSVNLSTLMLSSVPGKLDDMSFKGVFFASVGNLVLLLLLKHVNILVASLSTGTIWQSTFRGQGLQTQFIHSMVREQAIHRSNGYTSSNISRNHGIVSRYTTAGENSANRSATTNFNTVRRVG